MPDDGNLNTDAGIVDKLSGTGPNFPAPYNASVSEIIEPTKTLDEPPAKPRITSTMAKPSLTQATLDRYRHDLHAQHGQALAALLQPGESLEEFSVARVSASVKAPPMRLLPKGGRIEDWAERAVRVQAAVDYAPGDAFFRVVGWLTGTRPAMTGGWEGEAGRFVVLVYAASKQNWTIERQFCLARTDRRLVLLTAPWMSGSRPLRLLTEYPSGSIMLDPDWQLRPGGNQVDVGFADGSTLELRAGFPSGALLAQVLGRPVQLP